MSTLYKIVFFFLLSALTLNNAFCQQAAHHKSNKVQLWLTDPSDSTLFKQKPAINFGNVVDQSQTITVDKSKVYQSMDGFGYALTGGSAMLINRMSADGRAKLLNELFTTNGNAIGVSYLRISVGSSDLDDHVFSYDDLPAGETDPQFKKFSLAADETNLIPVLKQILAINPKIKILVSPWSPPAWMKARSSASNPSPRRPPARRWPVMTPAVRPAAG